jgi:hypothetical protein
MMEWMSRMLIGEMAGADEDFAEIGQMRMQRLLVAHNPTLILQLSMIHMDHMDQMILSEPSIILNFSLLLTQCQ